MGSLLSKKKKTKQMEQYEDSPKTTQEVYNTRRNVKPIYPPSPSILKKEPKRLVPSEDDPLYQTIRRNSEIDHNNHVYENTRYHTSSYFLNHYLQCNDDDDDDNGTFAVLARYPMNDCITFRV